MEFLQIQFLQIQITCVMCYRRKSKKNEVLEVF